MSNTKSPKESYRSLFRVQNSEFRIQNCHYVSSPRPSVPVSPCLRKRPPVPPSIVCRNLLPTLFALTSLVALPVSVPSSAIAGTCVAGSSCAAPPIQFVPGQPVSIEVANLTGSPVSIQHVGMMNPLTIAPRQTVSVLRGTTVSPNFSLIFWRGDGEQLLASIHQPADQVLRVEIRSGGRFDGNSAVYLQDDGRVEVF